MTSIHLLHKKPNIQFSNGILFIFSRPCPKSSTIPYPQNTVLQRHTIARSRNANIRKVLQPTKVVQYDFITNISKVRALFHLISVQPPKPKHLRQKHIHKAMILQEPALDKNPKTGKHMLVEIRQPPSIQVRENDNKIKKIGGFVITTGLNESRKSSQHSPKRSPHF